MSLAVMVNNGGCLAQQHEIQASLAPLLDDLHRAVHGALYGFTLSANARVVSHLGAEDVYSAHLTATLSLALAYVGAIAIAAVILILGSSLGMMLALGGGREG